MADKVLMQAGKSGESRIGLWVGFGLVTALLVLLTRALLAAVPRLSEGAPLPRRARWSADPLAVQ